MNYNKKDNATKYISIESNTNYQNPNIDYSGNPNLQPTIFDNYEEVSAYDCIY
jgi:hypothetical protein